MAEQKLTKNQRREEARLAAQRLREQQERAARRQRTLWIGLGTFLLIAVAVIAFVVVQKGQQTPLADVKLKPVGSTESGGIPVGPEGVAGSTDGAAADAVTVAVYSDFMCPICSMFEQINADTLDEMRESGDIVVEYHPVSILDRASNGTAYSTRSATAAVLVSAEAPEKFIAFSKALFESQPAENTDGLSDAQLADIARKAGVPDDVAAKIESGEYMGDKGDPKDPTSYRPWVLAATDQASRDLGRLGTPTIRINGETLDPQKFNWQKDGELKKAIEAARG